MTHRPRLFARTCEADERPKKFSSENFIIVLFDIYLDDTFLRQELIQLPNCNYVRINTVNDCLDLIIEGQAKDALITVIISKQFIDFICHSLSENILQLPYIYLFDDLFDNQQIPFSRQFRGTFRDVESLFVKLKYDIEKLRSRTDPPTGFQYVLQDNSKFYWYRFFFNVLDRLQHTNIAKHEIFPNLRSIFADDPKQLRMLDEFEHDYQPNEVIQWYTRALFFFFISTKHYAVMISMLYFGGVLIFRILIDLFENYA